MCLDVLKDKEQIGGFDVDHATGEDCVNWPTQVNPVYIDHPQNIIHFKIQDGPIREVGVNGCGVDTLIHAARDILLGVNKKMPCNENMLAVNGLNEALSWLNERSRARIARGVEGTSEA